MMALNKIHSVKRLSDGEVFTIGDKVNCDKCPESFSKQTIEKFIIADKGFMIASCAGVATSINNISKVTEQPKNKDVFDGEKLKRFISDEYGQMTLVFKMNGCKFRWDAFKMAYEMSHPKSIQEVTKRAQEIIDWVNENHKPLLKFSPQEKNQTLNH
jgi:hypothetical protein